MPWLLRVAIGWVLLAIAFFVTTKIVPGIHVLGGVGGYLLVALVFGLINAVLGRILRVLTIPISVVTFGFFLLVLNGFLLWLAEHITSFLVIEHFFWDAILGAIVLGIVSWALNWLLHRAEQVFQRS
jgi:putative membrane protein